MRSLFILILLLPGISACAQSDVIINTATFYIAEGRYNDAEKYLDSLLQQDPRSIDALMMKGNVLLNYEIMVTPPQKIITAEDESIYAENSESNDPPKPIVLISGDRAFRIEAIWQQCIAIDSGRLDIREGLCTLYGMADMKKELLDYLPVIAHFGQIKGDNFVAVLIQYAQLLSERGDKEGSYEVYKKIAALYPAVSSVWCALSGAYYTDGDLVNAKLYADKAFNMPSSDMSACTGAWDVYNILGDYKRALALLKTISPDSYSFYDGIYRYANHDMGWKKEMEKYIKHFPTPPDSDIVYTTATYMLSDSFKDDYAGFIYLLSRPIGNQFFSGLILDKAMTDFKDKTLPYTVSASAMVSMHNYKKANEIYAAVENKVDTNLRHNLQTEYAYSLYLAKEYPQAIKKWSALGHDEGTVSLADYFIGQCYLKSGDADKAKSYFQKAVEIADSTQYSYLAKLQLEKLGVK